MALLSENQKRGRAVITHVTEEDYGSYRETARAAGCRSVSEWIRQVLAAAVAAHKEGKS